MSAVRHVGGIDLSIADVGPGLPAGREMQVFDTFARFEGSDRQGGTGLGLAIVKGFAEAMGIGVSAHTAEDPRGAVFTLHIPGDLLVSARGSE